MNYKLGLDIGIASVGWAVINLEKERIEDLGVRTFEKAEVAKTGKALAEDRRMKRGTRRRNRRKNHRIERIQNFLLKYKVIEPTEIILDEKTKERTGLKLFQKPYIKSPFELRKEALDRKLEKDEIVRVLIHLAQRRGFQSNKKSDTDSKMGELLKGVAATEKILLDNNYRTLGEMFATDEKFKERKRNKNGDYGFTVLRAYVIDEAKKIFEAQNKFENEFLNLDNMNEYIKILSDQRTFDDGPDKPSPYYYEGGQIAKMLGFCTFEKEERRAPKNTYSSEQFVLLQKINNLKKVTLQSSECLSKEEKEKIINLVYSKKTGELKYKDIRKELKMKDNEKFNISYSQKKGKKKTDDVSEEENLFKSEEAKFVTLKGYAEIKKLKLSKDYFENIESDRKILDILDKIIEIVSIQKTDESIKKEFEKTEILKNVPLSDIEEFSKMKVSGTSNLSRKAILNLLPFLKDGLTYDKACDEAHYDFKFGGAEYKKGKLLDPKAVDENQVTSPVVLRSISQTIKVVNSIIRKYGSPYSVHIEVGNEVSKSFSERREIEDAQKDNQKNNEKIVEEIKKYGISSPTGKQIQKYKLYKEQEGKCVYSFKPFSLKEILEDDHATDIDHIIPYSRSVDDSNANKVLVFPEENRNKSNKLPYEYIHSKNQDWEEYKTKINSMKLLSYRKKKNLLRETFTREDSKGWRERNLNDSRHISRFLKNFIERSLEFSENQDDKKQRVYSVTGKLTAQLRARWGLSKLREENDLHHALDAAVIANVDQKMILKTARFALQNELPNAKDIEKEWKQIIDEETGEVLDDFTFSVDKHFPAPWQSFRDELRGRLFETNPKKYFETIAEDKKTLTKFNYDEEFISNIKPIFVSRAPRRKVGGTAHLETISSAKKFDDGYVISKTPLSKIKLSNLEDMYNKESDLITYNLLKSRLEEFNNNPELAFKEPVYKNKEKNVQIKSIKLKSTQNTGVLVNGGIASNGDMVRIDVFNKNNKFYIVPIYVHQTKLKELPNKAIVAKKPYSEWDIMDDKDFIYSFYPSDLMKITFQKEVEFTNHNENTKEKKPKFNAKEIIGYYISTNSNDGAVTLSNSDNSLLLKGIGTKTLKNIEKYQVDILGNVTKVGKETRQSFSK